MTSINAPISESPRLYFNLLHAAMFERCPLIHAGFISATLNCGLCTFLFILQRAGILVGGKRERQEMVGGGKGWEERVERGWQHYQFHFVP